MIYKRFLIGLVFLTTTFAIAQEGTTSPYSFYGIGLQKFRGTMENRAMGGLGVFSDSIHLNLQNPAAYSELRLINFSIAASYQLSHQSNIDNSQRNETISLDYLALGIPIGKLGVGFGILPNTAVGYHFLSQLDNSVTEYMGNGGLNRVYFSAGYKILPYLSLGIEGSYNFGKIENSSISQQTDVQYGTRIVDHTEISGFNLNFGVIYKKTIAQNLELNGTVTYSPGLSHTSRNLRRLSTVSIRTSGISTRDQREIERPDTEFTAPSSYSIGLGISHPKNWGVGIEYSNQQLSEFNNTPFQTVNTEFKDASKYRIGGFYIPEYNSFNSFFKRIVYRAGFRYEETGINIDNNAINEFGISFGFGIPMVRSFSNINFGFEIGQRATKNHGLIQENFFNAIISFSLNDLWFEKRLFD